MKEIEIVICVADKFNWKEEKFTLNFPKELDLQTILNICKFWIEVNVHKNNEYKEVLK